MQFDDTIIAQASAHGAAARGILRISGPGSVRSLQDVFEPKIQDCLECLVVHGRLHPWNDSTFVDATIFYWPKGHGYTGEESLEIHTVGSQPILDAIHATLISDKKIRLAKPGEFTMRAFLAGRLDLTQAEAVLGVIDAKSDEALETALDQLAGGVGNAMRRLRRELLDVLAHLEAGFDFSDEDIEFVSINELRRQLETALSDTKTISHRMKNRRLHTEKPRIVLFGPPNVGKTTLFNRLLGSDRGIVSPVPGTTRDYIEAEWTINATNNREPGSRLACTLVDTAGIDEILDASPDVMAQHLAREVLADADLIVFCVEKEGGLTREEERFVEANAGRLVLYRTKKTNDVENLRREIVDHLRRKFSSCDVVETTAVRCRDSLERAVQSLETGLGLLDPVSDESLVAAEIRVALNALGEIVGEVHTDDLLDAIFSRFCIGK